jgi:hypothetical protein
MPPCWLGQKMLYQVYCIDLDNCGYAQALEILPERLLCEECGFPLLVYDIKDAPSFIMEIQNELYPLDSEKYESSDNKGPE